LQPETFFSPDYLTARDRFRRAAQAGGARLDELKLDARGPNDEPLGIDIATIGAEHASRLVLQTVGLHGVEAFAGSAIQLAALGSLRQPPPGCALVLVHVLNPYGMAWLRRVNEHNVDLNRNFGPHAQNASAASGLYERIDAILNPPSAPGFDWFPLAAAALTLRYGYRNLRQTVAEGQYTHPRGLFYGGADLEAGPQHYLEWLRRNCARAKYVFGLDVHTGLGRRGESTLILEAGVGVTPAATLARALQNPLVDPVQGDSVYVARGTMGSSLPEALPNAGVDFVLQELGTYPSFKVFRALRQENRWHHYGKGSLDHRAKRALLEALCPESPAWRQRVVVHGTRLLAAACDWTFHKSVSGEL
jgi:Protein of unknown function (DUF2817)